MKWTTARPAVAFEEGKRQGQRIGEIKGLAKALTLWREGYPQRDIQTLIEELKVRPNG